jgi:hypothetical protein
VTDGESADLTGALVAALHVLEMSVAFERRRFRAGLQIDIGDPLDPVHEVPRHGVRQSIPADEHEHARRRLRQEHGRLSR